jgi:hypothetical protein
MYHVKIEGDVRNIIYTLPDMIGVKYNTADNKTEVLVKANKIDEKDEVVKYFYRLHVDLEKHKKAYKKEQVEVIYLQSFTV